MEYSKLKEGVVYNHPTLGLIKLEDKPNFCFSKLEDKGKTIMLPISETANLSIHL